MPAHARRTRTVAPYGSWKSPITADLIVKETISLDQIALDGNDIYWIEMRPAEKGRNVIVCRTVEGEISDRIGPAFDARTRVHEYGGGAFAAVYGTLYFSNFQNFMSDYSHSTHVYSYEVVVGAAYTL